MQFVSDAWTLILMVVVTVLLSLLILIQIRNVSPLPLYFRKPYKQISTSNLTIPTYNILLKKFKFMIQIVDAFTNMTLMLKQI